MDSTEKLKAKIRRLAEVRRMASCMNDTKWAELRTAMMEEMPFEPPYMVKFLTDDGPCDEECSWHEAYVYENCFNGAFAIEWIRIRPCIQKKLGMLIEPETMDAHGELEQILKKYTIPYEEADGVYIIYGYLAPKG